MRPLPAGFSFMRGSKFCVAWRRETSKPRAAALCDGAVERGRKGLAAGETALQNLGRSEEETDASQIH